MHTPQPPVVCRCSANGDRERVARCAVRCNGAQEISAHSTAWKITQQSMLKPPRQHSHKP